MLQQPSYEPTPDEIAAECRRIQDGWVQSQTRSADGAPQRLEAAAAAAQGVQEILSNSDKKPFMKRVTPMSEGCGIPLIGV